MRLIRFGQVRQEKPGILSSDGTYRDCSAFGEDWDENFFATNGIVRLREWLSVNEQSCPAVSDAVRLGAPVGRPSKLVCIGLNYASHARESGMDVPERPVVFMKSTTSICGPFDDVHIPVQPDTNHTCKSASEVDWEVELALVIGQECYQVPKESALQNIAGYTIHNDVSERETQLRHGGQWVKGKSYDTFAPLGPLFVTADEVSDPGNLQLWLKLNGELVQNGNTDDLIFDIPTLVSYLSYHMRLLPGDIVSTGTPSGVGLGQVPPRFLKAGDIMELGIDQLGCAKQNVVSGQLRK